MAQLIEAQATAWSRSKKTLWKLLRSTERIRKTARNVRHALQKTVVHRPLAMVVGPGTHTARQEFHSKVELEKACLAEAGRRFTQAKDTPFLTSPLIERFGECGKTQAVNQVLEGTFEPPLGCDPLAARLLLAFARPETIHEVPPRTITDYTRGWQKARETTSSSASGIHFGHYIAGTFNPEILLINATLADIPLRTGFSYDRWKKGLNIMIEKAAGDFNVEKLRIILLFEADFNANNKWLGRAIMYQAEKKNQLAEEQYGSRKFKSAIAQCLNKNLLYDLIRFRRTAAALCSNDAKSCYDRITLLAAVLCLCRLGCSQSAAASMITTIHDMQHHIRTTFGDSTQSANRTIWQAPIAGIGQGNGAGPHIWAAVSSPMLDVMRSEGFYAHVISAITLLSRQVVGFAFVDDTDLCVFGRHVNSQNATEEMQRSVTQWEGLLRATGGALVPTKCFWYLMDFSWTNNKWRYCNRVQSPGELVVKDDSQHSVQIPRLETFEARRTLGVRLAPDGNWTAEVEYLQSVANDWQVKMAASKLSPQDALFSLKNVVLRKLQYPLVTTTFTPQQCSQIMAPLLKQGLPKAGVIRTFPRALAYGPLQYGGLEIPNLYTEQIIAHITTILRYGSHRDDLTGSLMHATAESMRLELGYNGELLAAPIMLAANVTTSWLKHVWLSTQEVAITLATDFAEVPSQRNGDIEIMRLFIRSGWRQPELYTLNQCRMFLRVFLLSDIVDGSGNTISTQFWDRPHPADSTFIWPVTPHPTSSSWELWRAALSKSLNLGRHHRLALPLGRWHAQHHPTGWFYHVSTHSLWRVTSLQWARHGGIPQRTRQHHFHSHGEIFEPPPMLELYKATVTTVGARLIMTGYQSCEQTERITDLCQAERITPFSLQWGLQLKLDGPQKVLLKALSEGHGYAVSDGSYKDESGAAAWIIEGQTSAARLTGAWHTPGHEEDHSSFRSEVAGVLGILYTLSFWVPTSTKPTLRLACDGLSVIQRLLNPSPIEPMEPHADLLAATRHMMSTCGYNIDLQFVRGHQDHGPTVLARDAWLNVEADLLAKQMVISKHIGPLVYSLPGYPWSCYIGKRRVVKQFSKTLRTFINGKGTQQYWEQRRHYTQAQIQEVDWNSLGRAMQSAPLQQRRWASKQMSGHFAHGKNMVRWKKRTSDTCPRCGSSPEDKDHITRCTQEEAATIWLNAITALTQWMKDEQSDPTLIKAITEGLAEWRSGIPADNDTPAFQKQSELGWQVALDGWITIEWRAQQEQYWLQWRRKKSSKRWASELIKKLWNISWDMWAHRNGVLHAVEHPHNDIIDSRTNEQLTTLYRRGILAVPRDAFNLFQSSLTELLQQPSAYKIKWIRSVEAAIARKQHHNFGAYLPEQRFMRRWLGLEA